MSAIASSISQAMVGQKPFWISHSKLTTYLSCPRKYRFSYVDQLTTPETPISLLLGSIAHEGVSHYLTTLALGHPVDPVAEFTRRWEEALEEQTVDFGAREPADVLATGQRLMELYPQEWSNRGYKVVLDGSGLPIVERELSFQLPGNIKVVVILDVLAENAAGELITIDNKFSAQASLEGFSLMSDQLLLQQMAVDANAEILGLGERRVAGGLFFEGIKAKIPTRGGKGPHYVVDAPTQRRSSEDEQEWIAEARNLVEDIRRGRFPKRPMSAFDSPCKLCDFVQACHFSDPSGLVKKKSR